MIYSVGNPVSFKGSVYGKSTVEKPVDKKKPAEKIDEFKNTAEDVIDSTSGAMDTITKGLGKIGTQVAGIFATLGTSFAAVKKWVGNNESIGKIFANITDKVKNTKGKSLWLAIFGTVALTIGGALFATSKKQDNISTEPNEETKENKEVLEETEETNDTTSEVEETNDTKEAEEETEKENEED